jgi:hypothetical protein
MERDGNIIAHGLAWPWQFNIGAGAVKGFTLVDWAADPTFPGAGTAIMKRMSALAPVTSVFSGTNIAKKMWTAIGFKPRNEVQVFALPLRPLAQALSRPSQDWKAPARLVRGALWASRASRTVKAGWTTRREETDPYLAACPVATFELHTVLQNGVPKGRFCLVYVPGQARIADAWVEGHSPGDWTQLYLLATNEARAHKSANEAMAYAPRALAQHALGACGYQQRGGGPLMIYDPGSALPSDVILPFQMINTDDAFLHQGAPGYLT